MVKINFKKEIDSLIREIRDLSFKEKILLLIIIVGVFFRFYNLSFYLHGDESIIAISSMKFFHEGFLEGLWYVREHPPIARIVMGLPTILTQSNYMPLRFIQSNMYIFDYLAFEALRDNYLQIRLTNAFFGTLTLLLIFLIGKQIKDQTAGLIAAAISSVSFNLITYSKLILMEAFFILTFTLTIYFFIKYLKKLEKKWLVLMSTSLLMCLGSRQLQPLLVVPTLFTSYYLLNKKKGLISFTAALIIPVLIIFLVIYPPRVFGFAVSQFGVISPNKFIGSTILELVNTLFLKYSLLMTFTLASFLILLFFEFKKVKGSLLINKKRIEITPLTVFFIAYLVLLPLIFFLTRYSIKERYTIAFIPVISLLFAYYSEKIIKNNMLYYPLIALSILNITNLLMLNATPSEFGYHEIGVNSLNQFSLNKTIGPIEEALSLIEDDPLIMSNDFNLLIFYNNSIPIPLSNSHYCDIDYITRANYIFTRGQIFGFIEGEDIKYFLCPLIEDFNNSTIYETRFLDHDYSLLKVPNP